MGFRYRYTCERIVVPPVQTKHLTSLHLSSLLCATAHYESYITGWVCGYNARMHVKASELHLHRHMLHVLAVVIDLDLL